MSNKYRTLFQIPTNIRPPQPSCVPSLRSEDNVIADFAHNSYRSILYFAIYSPLCSSHSTSSPNVRQSHHLRWHCAYRTTRTLVRRVRIAHLSRTHAHKRTNARTCNCTHALPRIRSHTRRRRRWRFAHSSLSFRLALRRLRCRCRRRRARNKNHHNADDINIVSHRLWCIIS